MSEETAEAVKEEAKEETRREPRRERGDRNAVYIGQKPLMSYALAALLQFNAGQNRVTLKARGRAISKAVDVAEVVKRRLLAGQKLVSDIKIDTEVLGEDMRNVSTIEITLAKK